MSTPAVPEEQLSNAQKVAARHAAASAAHNPTVEDVPDETDIPTSTPAATAAATAVTPSPAPPNAETPSAKAAGKRPVADPSVAKKTGKIDTSEEAFPSLGVPKPQATAGTTWGQRPVSAAPVIANGSNLRQGPTSAGQTMTLPGRYSERMVMNANQIKPKSELRRPLTDIIRDLNKRSKAAVEFQSAGGQAVFTGKGPTQESVQQALKDVANAIGARGSIKVPVPASVRPFIIGKQGANIQAISQRTGARIQLPRQDGNQVLEDDDTVYVDIEGNPLSLSVARHEIEKIVNERTSSVNTRLKTVPPELFPFLAGPNNSRIADIENGRDVRIKIPHYHSWTQQAPEGSAAFRPQEGHHIQLSGDREAVRQVQEELDREVQQLITQLKLNQIAIERERHQFIIGKKGQELQQFLAETGCSVILPPDHHPDAEEITIIGPADKIEEATNRVMDLASSMSMANVDIARQHPGSARTHAHDVSRYLQQRRALDEFERLYNAQIVTPTSGEGPSAWTIYARDGRNSTKARSDLLNLVQGHPPARFRNVNVHPYYRKQLQDQHAQQVRDQFGVHLVFPGDSEDYPLVLVYEGVQPSSEYSFPRSKPSPEEVLQFEAALQEAEQFIAALTTDEADLAEKSFDAPPKYHEKIQRFINRESQKEPRPARPVQFLNLDGPSRAQQGAETIPIQFRGPSLAVEEYYQRLADFIEEQIRDEAERGYTTTLPFPQKYANLLIGRKGENINQLREEFDVDIQVADGQVEIKGPKAKADACKSHVAAMGRKFEDERTHVLKIKPQFHGELIGAGGKSVHRLQTKTGTRIIFPRGTTLADDQSVADGASEAGTGSKNKQALDEVIIKGPSRGADEARDEILALYQYAMDNSHSATVSVEQSALGSLIGQGGREMDKIRTETDTRIDVPGSREVADPSGRVQIRIKGTKAGVEKAKKILESKYQTLADNVTKTMEVDKRHHRALIGQSGENIRRLVLEAGGSADNRRIIQFPRADSQDNTIRFDGHKDVIDKLIASIQEYVAERDSQVTDSVEVAPEKHGGLIGRGGSTRKALESQFGVTISIPSTSITGPERSQIKLTGKPEAVAKAKAHIGGLVKEQEATTVHVPHRLYHAVADGNMFRSFSNHLKVNVDHAGHPRPPKPSAAGTTPNGGSDSLPLITDAVLDPSQLNVEDHHKWNIVGAIPPATANEPTIPWVFKGSNSENVAEAVRVLEKALAEAEGSRTGYLVLPDPKTYRHVIGPAGSTINAIRKETDCKIDVPKQNTGPIEIRGKEASVERAKELIIEAVLEAQNR